MSEHSFPSGEQFSVQATETKRRPALDVEDFKAQADYISFTIAHEDDLAVGRAKAHEAYVEDEENPELKKFGKMMLIADKAAEQAGIIEKLKEHEANRKRSGGQLSLEETAKLHRSVRIVCAYNQMLEAMIAEHEEAMPKRQMTEWLTRASGNTEWAQKTMSGVAGEIAGSKIVSQIPGIKALAHGDLDQDLAGQDFVFTPTMMGVNAIDVKTGQGRPKIPVSHSKVNSSTLLLSLDPAHFDKTGYAIDEKYVPAYAGEIMNKL